jgi:hypothetical protein
MPNVKTGTRLDEALQQKVTLTKNSLKSSRVPSGSAFAFWMSNESSHLEGASLARWDASFSPSSKTPRTVPANAPVVETGWPAGSAAAWLSGGLRRTY